MRYLFNLRILSHFCGTETGLHPFTISPWNACRPCTRSQDSATQPDITTPFNFFLSWDYSSQTKNFLVGIVSCQFSLREKMFLWNTFFYSTIVVVTIKADSQSAVMRATQAGRCKTACRGVYLKRRLVYTKLSLSSKQEQNNCTCAQERCF